MSYLIQNMIQLWGITVCLSFSVGLLTTMKGSQKLKETYSPLTQFYLIRSYSWRALLPVLNLIYAATWLVMIVIEPNPSEYQISQLPTTLKGRGL